MSLEYVRRRKVANASIMDDLKSMFQDSFEKHHRHGNQRMTNILHPLSWNCMSLQMATMSRRG